MPTGHPDRPEDARRMPELRTEDRASARQAFLGVDGGGSSSQAAFWELGGGEPPRCRAEASFGPLSLKSSSEETVMSSARDLKRFIDEAAPGGILARAGAFGLSGLDDASDLERVAAILRAVGMASGAPLPAPWGHAMGLGETGQVALCSDALLPLASCGRRTGVAVIAGTGSVAYAVMPDGSLMRFGGWGYRASDEGSGQWVGCEFLRCALHAAEAWQAHPASALAPIAVDAAGAIRCSADEPTELAQALFAWSLAHDAPGELAALAKPALESDTPEAAAIADAAGQALARLATLACEAWLRRSPAAGRPPIVEVALGGALFDNARLRQRFDEELCMRLSGAHAGVCVRLLRPERPPTFGAASLARMLFAEDSPARQGR